MGPIMDILSEIWHSRLQATGHLAMPSCAADTGTLDGQLIVHFEQLEANMIVSATGPDNPFLQAEGRWIVGPNGLSPAGDLSISQHGQDHKTSNWQGTGGLFGPDGQEASLLIHMEGKMGL